jgi:hypothetical protein
LALEVVRYLAVKATCGLTYGSGGPKLRAYCDADYAGNVDSRRSTTCYVFVMHERAVRWSSRLQATVAALTVEAEFIGAAAAVKEALWFRKVARDIGPEIGGVQILYNNQEAMKLLKHPIASRRSKHIDVLHHFARERVARREVEFIYCPTSEMAADFFTKAGPVEKFGKCCEMVEID